MNVDIGSKRVKEHYDWLKDKLKKYSKDESVVWIAIVMHHPVLLEPQLKQDLLPLLQKYKVDMAIVGHQHMFEYANFGYEEKLKYPDERFGPVIDDCKDKDEIINTPSRVHKFKKGEVLHQFMIGGSGRVFKDICPYNDQDGKIYFQNTKEHGMMTIDVSSKSFTAKYLQNTKDSVFEVIITQ